MRRLGAIAVSGMVIAALAGCGPAPSEPTPTPTSSASVSASPTPTPTAEPLSILDCEALLSLELARSLFSENTEFLGETAAAEFSDRLGVPEIQSTVVGAVQARVCRWGVPNSDGLFSLVAAEISPEARTALETALTAAGFTSTTTGAVTALTFEGEGEVSSIGATSLFTGDLWLLCDATALSVSDGATGSALDAIRAANPTLGL